MNRIVAFCSIIFLQGASQIQEVRYMMCISETASQTFTLKPDSSLTYRETGEQWRGKNRGIGRWQIKGGRMIWKNDGQADKIFEIDTLRRLQFFVPSTFRQQWQSIRLQIINTISSDEDILIFETYRFQGPNSAQDREKILEHREFDIAFRMLCGSEILIRKWGDR